MSPADPMLLVPADNDNDANLTPSDPPPPYRERRPRRSRRHLRRSTDDEPDNHPVDPSEETPLLPSSPRSPRTRARTVSMSTSISAPSFTHTILSLFQDEPDSEIELTRDDPLLARRDEQAPPCPQNTSHRKWPLGSKRAWRRYLRPLRHKAYYLALFHLIVINFPYALAAWIYLFVFTLTGTTLLVALPLGAVLCFLDLLGARAFARGEVALQARFHAPLAHPPPYPPRPIFTRFRTSPPTDAAEPERDPESGSAYEVPHTLYEPSFYKNSYAMFMDPASYYPLLYFLVIKPPITLLIELFLLVFVPPALVLILPAPAVLRAARRLGIWQANVAVEGLYFGVG